MDCPCCKLSADTPLSLLQHINSAHPRVAKLLTLSFHNIKTNPAAEYWLLNDLKTALTKRKTLRSRVKAVRSVARYKERERLSIEPNEPMETVSPLVKEEAKIGAQFTRTQEANLEGKAVCGGLPSLGKR